MLPPNSATLTPSPGQLPKALWTGNADPKAHVFVVFVDREESELSSTCAVSEKFRPHVAEVLVDGRAAGHAVWPAPFSYIMGKG